MKKIALIGGGRMAEYRHMPALMEYLVEHQGEGTLSGIVDPDEERRELISEKFRFRSSHPDVAHLLENNKPDAALVLVPYWLVGKVAMELLTAGVHVFMEKPPGMSSREIRALAHAARNNQMIAQVGFNRRFWPSLRMALEEIADEGHPLQFLRATKNRSNRLNEYYAFYTYSHAIDFICSVGGEPRDVQNVRQPLSAKNAFNFLTTIQFKSGLLAQASGLPNIGYTQEIYEFHTEACTYIVNQNWDTQEPAVVQRFEGKELAKERFIPKDAQILKTDGFYGQLKQFFDSLIRDEPVSPSLEDCFHTMDILDCLQYGKKWTPPGTRTVPVTQIR